MLHSFLKRVSEYPNTAYKIAWLPSGEKLGPILLDRKCKADNYHDFRMLSPGCILYIVHLLSTRVPKHFFLFTELIKSHGYATKSHKFHCSSKQCYLRGGHRALLIFPLAAMLTFCQIIRKLALRIFFLPQSLQSCH